MVVRRFEICQRSVLMDIKHTSGRRIGRGRAFSGLENKHKNKAEYDKQEQEYTHSSTGVALVTVPLIESGA
jgi:hypothetical protein